MECPTSKLSFSFSFCHFSFVKTNWNNFVDILQAWEMHESGELVRLVDTSLEGDFNIEEALRFLKVALLCTQVMPKLRPSMRNVLKLLKGEVAVADKEISRPGLFSEFMILKANQRENILNTKNSSTGELSMASVETATSCATMTFTSILDRTN